MHPAASPIHSARLQRRYRDPLLRGLLLRTLAMPPVICCRMIHWLRMSTQIIPFNQSKGASHRGRRCHLQVHGLKDEAHLRWHLNDLTAHQTQLLVVVQHRVHILDPHGVHRPVKDKPFPVWALRDGENRISEGTFPFIAQLHIRTSEERLC